DGNGVPDDGCACSPGATQACYAGDPSQAGIGACVKGTQTCIGNEFGSWGACVGSGAPSPEICGDGIDNDCDGRVDQNCSSSGTGDMTGGSTGSGDMTGGSTGSGDMTGGSTGSGDMTGASSSGGFSSSSGDYIMCRGFDFP